MKAESKKRWWVSRDGGSTGATYYNFHHCCEKPKLILGVCFTTDVCTVSLTPEVFHELYILRLRPGQCKEIERPCLVLKQKGAYKEFSVMLTHDELVVLQDGDQGAADMVIDQILEQTK